MNPRKETVIYLDQNKWIDLARASYGRQDGDKYRLIQKLLKNELDNGNIIIPLDFSRFTETRKISNFERRKRLAQVMGNFSRGWTIPPPEHFISIEINNALMKIFGENSPCSPLSIGKGVGFASGGSEAYYANSGQSKSIQNMFNQFEQSSSGIFKYLVDVGSIGEEVKKEQFGISDEYVQKAEKFRQAAKTFSKTERKRAYYDEIIDSLNDEIRKCLIKFSKTYKQFLDLDKKIIISFCENVPIIDVDTELSTERSENLDRNISTHDLFDIGSLSVAIPYCDVVVTEKYFADLAIRKKLDKKYNTKIITDLNDLIKII